MTIFKNSSKKSSKDAKPTAASGKSAKSKSKSKGSSKSLKVTQLSNHSKRQTSLPIGNTQDDPSMKTVEAEGKKKNKSLMEIVKSHRSEKSGRAVSIKKSIQTIRAVKRSNSQFTLFSTIFLIVLSIPAIIFASINLRNCPVQQLIPYLLLTCGALAVFEYILELVYFYCLPDPENPPKKLHIIEILAYSCRYALLFVDLICFVTSVADVTYAEGAITYCDKMTYWMNVGYIILWFFCPVLTLLIAMSCICCILCCSSRMNKEGLADDEPTTPSYTNTPDV